MASSTTITTDDGTFIAASQRPDGTWRKPRKVKDGYTPQEEVPLYESKGRQFTKHPSPQYPVGLDPALIRAAEARKERQHDNPIKQSPIPGLVIDLSKTKSKKKKKAIPVSSLEEVNNVLAKVQLNFDSEFKEVTSKKGNKKEALRLKQVEVPKESESIPADPTKRIKNLRKRLREIETIELKISSGELKKLEKDQLDKVARKQEVLDEINQLEGLAIEEKRY